MSEEQETQANPYNARKEWHTPDGPPMQSADSLFFEEQQEATSEEKGTPTCSMLVMIFRTVMGQEIRASKAWAK